MPPVPNFKEVDPDLGALNLSRGGRYPVQYAIHLAAGFGSQIAMTLTRRIPGALDRVDDRPRYQRWLADVSGYDRAETEVVKRVLRVEAQGAPARPPAPSTWQLRHRAHRARRRPATARWRSPAPAPAGACPAAAGPARRTVPSQRRRAAAPGSLAERRQPRCRAAAARVASDCTGAARAQSQRRRPIRTPARPAPVSPRPLRPRLRRPCRDAAGRGSGRRPGAGDRRREDRLSAGHARPGPRPRGRPGRRHGQAGRDLRRRPRGLRHPAAGEPEAARLPDAGARDRSSSTRCGPTWQPAAGGTATVDGSARRVTAVAPPACGRRPCRPQRSIRSPRRCSRSSPRRPATRRTCSTWTSTSRPTWASTRSSRPRPSRPSARPSTSRARRT